MMGCSDKWEQYLEFPVEDTHNISNRLILAGFNPVKVKILTESAATFEAIEEAFNWLDDQENENTLVVVHYSGHGGQIDDDNDDDDDEVDDKDEVSSGDSHGSNRCKLLTPLYALATAQTTDALREIIHQYPDLLTPWADVTLTKLIQAAWQCQQLDRVCIFIACRAFLTRCHQIGREAAMAEQQILPLCASSPLAELLQPPKDDEPISRRIPLYRHALSQVRRKSEAELWATLQYELANCLARSREQDRAQKLEEAICLYQAVLEIWTPEKVPEKWAQVLHDLGSAFRLRVRGDLGENLKRAIRLYELALKVRTRDDYPGEWAKTQICLGIARKDFPRGDRAKNQKRAFKHYWAVRSVWGRRADPVGWARVHHNLGNLCSQSVCGNRAVNLERAIRHYRLALKIRTYEDHPVQWAMTQVGLANAYVKRIRGDRAENLERAVELYTETLRVRTREARPVEWAETQYDLAVAYRYRLYGDKAENQEKAIQCYEWALEVYTRESYPRQWANVHNDLGTAYNQRLRNDRAENIEYAIHHYIQSLKVRTDQSFPADWATTRNNLANAYCDRVRGNRELNLERAIRHYNQALRVRTQDTFPYEWAMVNNNLGTAYWERVRGDRWENLEKAICHFETALIVFEPATFPVDARRAARNLGNLFFEQKRWPEAKAPYEKARQAAENLYQASLLRASKETELAETADLYRRTAYVLARAGQPQEAVLAVEQGRARGLAEALARDRTDLEKVRQIDAAAYEQYRRVAECLRQLEAAERAGAPAATREASPLTAEALRQEALQARAGLDAAIARIRKVEGYEGFMALPVWEDVARAIRPGWPLVYLVTTPAGSLALVVHRQDSAVSVEAIWADLFTFEDLDGLLVQRERDEVLGGYLSGQLFRSEWLKESLAQVLPTLGEQVIEPVAARLRAWGAEGVVLVPGGRLGLLPLHAARYRVDGRRVHLLDEFVVADAPNARAWKAAQDALALRQRHPPTLAGVGNPLPHPKPLPFARAELEEVADLFTAETRRPLYEEQATRSALLQRLPGATHVHLACHGLFDLETPLASRLELSRQEALTLGQVLDELASELEQARLVVLSACQSAIPEFRRLPDEVIGLPTGFFQAGVPGVVGTLWPVNDLSTALLMLKFYEYHLRGDEGPSPARALRRAQRWLRDVTAGELLDYFERHHALHKAHRQAERERMPEEMAAAGVSRFVWQEPEVQPFADPYYWAPFIFVGV